MFKFQITF